MVSYPVRTGTGIFAEYVRSLAPRIKPLDVACRRCGATVGEVCQRVVHGRGQNWRKLGRHPHRDRVYDAKKASAAAEALLGN